MPDVNHSQVNVASVHPINGVSTFADVTARNAYTYATADIGKVVRVGAAQPYAYYIITGVSAGVATFSEALGVNAAAFIGATYTSLGAMTYPSTTWEDIHNIVTFSNDHEAGVSRANSDFTFAAAGTYRLTLLASVSGLNSMLGFRWRNTAPSTVADFGFWAGSGGDSPCIVFDVFLTVTAGQVLKLQYCRAGGSNSTFNTSTIDGEAVQLCRLNIVRLH